MVLVAPLKELGSAAEVPRGVFRDASLLCWGKGGDGGPFNGSVKWAVPFVRPVFGD